MSTFLRILVTLVLAVAWGAFVSHAFDLALGWEMLIAGLGGFTISKLING